MTNFQRIKQVFYGLCMLIGAMGLLTIPTESYILIVLILTIYFTIRGIRMIWYYFTMARYMVDGREAFFTGVIWLDFGIITGSLTGVPHYFIILYLVAIHGFSGAVRILRTMEARKNGASNWKMKLIHGIVDFTMALTCVIFLNQSAVTVVIYSIGLISSALMRMITAFRPTRFEFIK